MIDFAKYRTVDDVREVALLRYYVYRSVVIIVSGLRGIARGAKEIGIVATIDKVDHNLSTELLAFD